MKNKTFYFCILLFASVVGIYSCEKDEKNDTSDLLINNIWVYDTLSVSDTESEGLMFAAVFMHLGFAKSEFDYSSDGNYTIKSDMIDEGGIWQLTDNKIIMDKDTEDEFEMEILTLNNSIGEFKVPMEGEFFTIPYSGYVILKFHTK